MVWQMCYCYVLIGDLTITFFQWDEQIILFWYCRSEGYLCLPEKFSINHNAAIDRIINGNFK